MSLRAPFAWLGDRAIRFARPPVSPRELVAAVRGWPGVVDVVVGVDTVAAYFDAEAQIDESRIVALAALAGADDPPRSVTIHVVYDGEDLDMIAATLGLHRDEVTRLHQDTTFTVETIGFAPGFAYLAGLPQILRLPRRATPRPRIAAGSLAIAGAYSAVYPFDSPGGWHVIGRVIDGPMFTANGARLAYGDRVRFDGGMS